MLPRFKRALSSVGYHLLAGLLLWFVVGSIVGWFVDLPGTSRHPERESRAGLGIFGPKWARPSIPIYPANESDVAFPLAHALRLEHQVSVSGHLIAEGWAGREA